MSDAEKWYDTEIAPVLLDLAKKCADRGAHMVAVVEYEPGERGRTTSMGVDAGIEMVMLNHCAKTGANVDGYIIGLLKHARENSIDVRSSIVLSRWGS